MFNIVHYYYGYDINKLFQIVVREDWLARAIMHISEQEKLVLEGGAAVGMAAILAGLFPNLKGKK